MTNAAGRALRVRVSLQSPHLTSTPTQTLVLAAGQATTLTFPVDLRTNGRFTVEVRIESPTGRVIAHPELVVRSTAFNRVALLITLAAAAMLLIVWARRFLPRRTS
jgi:subtilisin-like proprotein convertase family protein